MTKAKQTLPVRLNEGQLGSLHAFKEVVIWRNGIKLVLFRDPKENESKQTTKV